jgi:polyisoprenoid-binding protein YceI
LRTGIGRRDKHLRSADFFDVERYPEISVVVTALAPTTGNAADLRASFTIKGINAPVPLRVRIAELNDASVRIAGETKVDRSQFGLTWNRFGVISRAATVAAEAIFVRAPQ